MGLVQIDMTCDPTKHFLTLSNELSIPIILACPADTREPAPNWKTFSRNNVSYFIGVDSDETYPQSIVAGDRNLTTNDVRLAPGLVRIEPKSRLGWDNTQHRRQGNVTMGDGSVQQLSLARLREQGAVTTNITLVVP